MIDKVQKIREKVEKRYECWKEKESNSHSIESEIRMSECQHLLLMLDSLQEEPVSEDLKEIAWNHADKKCYLDIAVFTPDEVKKERGKMQFTWQDLYDAVMFGAEWQKEQFEKERLKHCDELTNEQAQIESDFVTQHLKENNRTPTFIDAIEYGMRLKEKEMQSTIELAEDHAMLAGMNKMEEQMMAKAIDGEVITTSDYGWENIRVHKKEHHCGQKVKVIVIKEE